MDLSKLKTNKRILKSLGNEIRDSYGRKTIDDLWDPMLEQILNQFKFKLPENPDTNNTMDDMKAMLAEFDINGLRIKEKQRHNSRGMWATNYSREDEEIYVTFKNFEIKVNYDPDGRHCSWSRMQIDFQKKYYSQCRYEKTDKMDLRRIVTMLINLDNAIDDFRDNHWPEMKTNIQKQLKITQMAENTIEILLRGKMKGTGIPFVIEKQKTRVKVTFDVGKKTMVEMAVSHKNFTEQIDKIIAAVKQLREFISNADMQIRIKQITTQHGAYYKWQNTEVAHDED